MIKIAINEQLIQDVDQLLVIAPPVVLTIEDNGTADKTEEK